MTDSRSELMALAPCPFCGGPATMECIDGGIGARWSAGCSADEADCMGYQSLTTFDRRGDAAKAWNKRPRRAVPQPDREMVARIIEPFASGYTKEWHAAVEKANTILLLLVGGDQKKSPSDGQHQTEQSGKQLSQATDPELLALLERAKSHVMTPAERYEQRHSFVRVMCPSNRGYAEWCAQVDKIIPPMVAETDTVAPGDAGLESGVSADPDTAPPAGGR